METLILIWNFLAYMGGDSYNQCNSLEDGIFGALIMALIVLVILLITEHLKKKNNLSIENRIIRNQKTILIVVSIGIAIIILILGLLCCRVSKLEKRVLKIEFQNNLMRDSIDVNKSLLREIKKQNDSIINLLNMCNSKSDSLISSNANLTKMISKMGNEVSLMKNGISNFKYRFDSLEKGLIVKMDSLSKMVEECCENSADTLVSESVLTENFSIGISKKVLSRNGNKIKSGSVKLYTGIYPVSILPGKGFSKVNVNDNFYNSESNELFLEMNLSGNAYSFYLIKNSEKIILNSGAISNIVEPQKVAFNKMEFTKVIQVRETPNKTKGIIQVIAGGLATVGGVAGGIYYVKNPELIFKAKKGGEEFAGFNYRGFAIPFFGALTGGGIYLLSKGIVNIRGTLTELTITGRF